MKDYTTLSSKGQIVIPKRIREQAGLNSGQQMEIEWDGERIGLRKVYSESAGPGAGIVRELLGKYNTEAEESESDSARAFRETLYGKIDSGQ
jgi:AbrB family looped-hinge helix DNA binding protein